MAPAFFFSSVSGLHWAQYLTVFSTSLFNVVDVLLPALPGSISSCRSYWIMLWAFPVLEEGSASPALLLGQWFRSSVVTQGFD